MFGHNAISSEMVTEDNHPHHDEQEVEAIVTRRNLTRFMTYKHCHYLHDLPVHTIHDPVLGIKVKQAPNGLPKLPSPHVLMGLHRKVTERNTVPNNV